MPGIEEPKGPFPAGLLNVAGTGGAPCGGGPGRPGVRLGPQGDHSDGNTPPDLEAAGVCAPLHKPVEPDVLYGLLKTRLH